MILAVHVHVTSFLWLCSWGSPCLQHSVMFILIGEVEVVVTPTFSYLYPVPCTFSLVPCTLYLVPSHLYLVSCTLYHILYLVPSHLYLVPCALCLLTCTLYPVPCTFSLVLCTLYLVPCTLHSTILLYCILYRVSCTKTLYTTLSQPKSCSPQQIQVHYKPCRHGSVNFWNKKRGVMCSHSLPEPS